MLGKCSVRTQWCTKGHQEASFLFSFILGQRLASQPTGKSILRAGLDVFCLPSRARVSLLYLLCDPGGGVCVCVDWAGLHLGLSFLSFDFWEGSVKEKRQLEARRRGTDELDCLGGHSPLLWPFRLPDCGSPQITALSLVSFLQVCKLNFYETAHSSSWSGPLISYQNSDRYKVFYLSSILPGRPWGMSHLVNRVLFLLSLMSSFQAYPLRVFCWHQIPYSNGLVYTKGQASTPCSPPPPNTLRMCILGSLCCCCSVAQLCLTLCNTWLHCPSLSRSVISLGSPQIFKSRRTCWLCTLPLVPVCLEAEEFSGTYLSVWDPLITGKQMW